jgi:RNA polymerase sigma-70 factor (ECF subfamily)
MKRRRAAPGDVDALRRVYREHVSAVFAFFSYAVSRETAEDLTASTFEKVIRAWSGYDVQRGPERAWVLAIARNLLTDHYRRQSHRDTVSTDQHPLLLDALSSDDWVERRLTRADLHGWLEQLGQREREILALRYGADLPATDIAELTGLTAANVHQIVSRSLRRLRELAEQPAPSKF